MWKKKRKATRKKKKHHKKWRKNTKREEGERKSWENGGMRSYLQTPFPFLTKIPNDTIGLVRFLLLFFFCDVASFCDISPVGTLVAGEFPAGWITFFTCYCILFSFFTHSPFTCVSSFFLFFLRHYASGIASASIALQLPLWRPRMGGGRTTLYGGSLVIASFGG